MTLAPATLKGRRARQRAIARNVRALPSPAEMVDSVLSIVGEATDSEYINGQTWYARAHRVACELDPSNHDRASGVLAALSPQTSWHTNIGLATEAYANGADTIGHFQNAIDKASDILMGAHPVDILGGRKVRSFYCNIAHPNRPGRVTVDRHAVAIALGTDPSLARFDPIDPHLLDRVGVYQLVASAYRGAARELGIYPHECQAIAWVTWRRLSGADIHDGTVEIF